MAQSRARMDELEQVLNHPGHADQKSHGRKGGIRKVLADAKTTEQVASVLADGLTSTLGHPVRVNLQGMDVQVAREHAEGLLQGAERFPNSRLAVVDTYGKGGVQRRHPSDPFGLLYGVTGHGGHDEDADTISFNVGQTAARYRADITSGAKEGYHVADSPIGVAIHEFGHTLQHDNATRLGQQAADRAARQAGQSTGDYVSTHISRYAAEEPHEMGSEAFTDVMLHGAGASALSKAIFDQIEADYESNGANRGPTALLARTYKRDRAGKFSTTGGGVRQSLQDAATTEAVAAVLAQELGATLGHTVDVNLHGMDTQIAREHAEGLLQGAERFPNVRLAQVLTYGPGGAVADHPGDPTLRAWAVTSMGNYSRNADVISFRVDEAPDSYRGRLAAAETTGFSTVGTPMGVAYHEFGHLLQHDNAAARGLDLAGHTATQAGQPVSRYVADHVSRYATDSPNELGAEAFADVMAHGDDAAPLSAAIYRQIESDYARNGARR